MSNRKLSETIPVAPLKIITSPSSIKLGQLVNKHLVHYRLDNNSRYMENAFDVYGYKADTYLVKTEISRFGSGEAKATIQESIRGKDLFIISDVLHYNHKYQMNQNITYSSPDDHFQDLKRLIAAASISHPYRINLIMPFLYESRLNERTMLESLDCAVALQELAQMGVENFITFDAHDPRVQNAIPIRGFDNFFTSFQFIRELIKTEIDLIIDKEHLMVISPDEGGMSRAAYYADILGVEMGTFYKRRDYSSPLNIDGEYPELSHSYLGSCVKEKSILLIDDMIASGKSILNAAKELKERGANHIYIIATFGLFNNGLEVFDFAYQNHIFDRIFTTNLTYFSEELNTKPYYINVDLSKYIALIIDTLNHDTSINDILNPSKEIQELLKQCKPLYS